eukprot:TRINITY_DN3854_c0_g2_i1.p1 TRINITY_DN3854_c0_g2~~TRINITY_DN3854_c0_g2_i1.p1  ORF type:complete len:290 (-),score=61.20 TRINITY_DN3854_c0_g2_i1:54-923(-)
MSTNTPQKSKKSKTNKQKQEITEEEKNQINQLIIDLIDPQKKDNSLAELCKRKDFPNLATLLWYSTSTISSLLQEIISIYPYLHVNSPYLKNTISERISHCLTLFQCVAAHQETRVLFLNAHIPLFLYPILNTMKQTQQYETLKGTCLGVIGELVKSDNSEVINFLLQAEIIPICLQIMETGEDSCKTIATFILQKILFDNNGLTYICATLERFNAVTTVLSSIVLKIDKEKDSARLLKHIIRCYHRLTENTRAKEALKTVIPPQLKELTNLLDNSTKKVLNQLLTSLV